MSPVGHNLPKLAKNTRNFAVKYLDCNTCVMLQVLVQKQVPTLQALMAKAQLPDTAVLAELAGPDTNAEVSNWDLVQRGEP